MRLNRLDLTRYGRFTDFSLTFPPPPADGPDLHVILGPNEAGKSTFLSAWLDLLFRIPRQTAMGFLHPNAAMEIGANLTVAGTDHPLIRRKKDKTSLFDPNGNPVPEAVLQTGLHGLDRASYPMMFSLDRDTLEQGGESILASEGDLGALLFQASAGLSDLSAQLGLLKDQADDFLSRSGRKGRLRDLRAEVDEISRQIRDMDTAAADHARLSADRDAAHSRWQDAREAAETAQAGLSNTERLAAALPLAARLDRLDKAIAGFRDLPVPPQGWLDELPGLDRNNTELTTRQETAGAAIARLETRLSGIAPDPAILDVAPAIAQTEALKAAHDRAEADLPRRQAEYAALTETIRQSLARLGQPEADPATLLPESRVLGRLRDLAATHSGLVALGDSAREEASRAQDRRDELTAQIAALAGGRTDLRGLEGLVRSIRRDDPVGQDDRARDRLAAAEDALARALSDLAPWRGGGEELAALVPPDASTLDQLADQLADSARVCDRCDDAVDRLADDVTRLKDRLPQAGAAAEPAAAAAARARSGREAAWAAHRQEMTEVTADDFETAMRNDDQASAMLAEARRMNERASAEQQALDASRRQLAAARQKAEAAKAAGTALQDRLSDIMISVTSALPRDMPVGHFRDWLARLATAQAALLTRDDARRATERTANRVSRARHDLLLALQEAGQDPDPGTGLALAVESAESLLALSAKITALNDAHAKADADLNRRIGALQAAQEDLTAWRAQWAAACDQTWMAGNPPDVAEMREILDELDRLAQMSERARDLAHRIAAMRSDQDRFRHAVAALAGSVGMPSDQPADQVWQALTKRLRDAQRAAERRADLQAQLETAQGERAELDRQTAVHQARINEFCGFFNVPDWPKARISLTRAGEKAAMIADRQQCAADLCGGLQVTDESAAISLLAGLDDARLTARSESARTELKTLRTAQEEAHTAFQLAKTALDRIGGDDAVARLAERRQTLLLEIEAGAQQHLERRLGILAVETALRRYRETHRSGMLTRASRAFSIMTSGRYGGLSAQPDDGRDILIALTADGGSRHAGQLSDGTRAQLYLALRIAGYTEFVGANGPVPFIADDIMESFDDSRADATFGLLADMARSGQVIYLTHHAHLVEMVRASCPAAQIHTLPE
ncbi:MAG: AAA family ATPase [Marinibacterium sp.]